MGHRDIVKRLRTTLHGCSILQAALRSYPEDQDSILFVVVEPKISLQVQYFQHDRYGQCT